MPQSPLLAQCARHRWYDPNNGRFTQEDPIGYGGGSNLYAFVGNNPAMFADPFGLCPYGTAKRDTNVNDCPQDKLGDAFRALDTLGGNSGKLAIQTVASRGLSIDLKSPADVIKTCGATTNGCISGTTITMNGSSTSADMATRIVHESAHSRMQGAYHVQEPIAWTQALQAYKGIRQLGASSFYEAPYQSWLANPSAFKKQVCVSAGGGNQC